MKRTQAMAVGEILRLYIDHDGDRAEFDRRKVEYLWSRVVGPSINKATVSRRVIGDVMHVTISSAPMRNELAFMAPALVKALNEAVGAEVISKILFH